jgi:hypothetical protein
MLVITLDDLFILDIKLKDYGSEQIEVSDNGNGVHQNNFEGLSKFYTIQPVFCPLYDEGKGSGE